MLQRSPRRKVFNDYAKQLMRRYPSMKDEINLRLQHLNGQWETLEKAISSGGTTCDQTTMLRGKGRVTNITKVQNSPLYRGVFLWDQLPETLQKEMELKTFKVGIRSLIKQNKIVFKRN